MRLIDKNMHFNVYFAVLKVLFHYIYLIKTKYLFKTNCYVQTDLFLHQRNFRKS
jgi:TRAP-type mannitol/chloroaromatic compound transport system permease small subunit